MNKRVVIIAAAVLAAAGAAWYVAMARRPPAPSVSPETYEQTVSAFYRGLASLDTGLLEMAKAGFTRATELAPAEPAAWANLAVARVRGAEFDAANEAIARAGTLAPDAVEIALIQAAIDNARGELDASVRTLRRVVGIDPGNVLARFTLADSVERAGGTNAETDAQNELDAVLRLTPDNLAVIVERARLAARRQDAARLRDSLMRLEAAARDWPDIAMTQLRDLRAAVDAPDFPAAQRAIAFLRNVLARVPAFREGLAAVRVPAELIANPLDRFVALPPASPEPAPADTALSYMEEPLADGSASRLLVWPLDQSSTATVFAASDGQVRRLGQTGAIAGAADSVLLPLDWNNDFKNDFLLGSGQTLRLLLQGDQATFTDATARAGLRVGAAITGAWIADLEMDGDVDVIVGVRDAAPAVFRNNGDGTSTVVAPFGDVRDVRGLTWSDLDGDGDPDAALLDAQGAVHVFANRQAGSFAPLDTRDLSAVALTSADLDGDGGIDLAVLDTRGALRRVTRRSGQWDVQQIGSWEGAAIDPRRDYRLVVQDYDNNGALDVLAAGGGGSALWLASAGGTMQPRPLPANVEVFAAADLNADGYLDLVGLSDGRPVRLTARATRPYHWQTIRPQAQANAGDQRINSFAVGGEIEARSGLLTQKQLLTGAPIHVGLGTRATVDVVRIVWPNGVMQAEFDPQVDGAIVAEQRLKGSCPWVFADNGESLQFVTDFLWRSPLGLRINAQDTAGVAQTEDWVRIRGDQLAPRNGRYDIRITAELWESHFFDHVSLLVVDHPPSTEVLVDERFARTPPKMALETMTELVPVAGAWDQDGRSQLDAVAARDGRHAAGFARGAYQGVAPEHSLELDLGSAVPAEGPLSLVAYGWLYPTDSSINVAIAQGAHPAPHGLGVDAQDTAGAWHTLHADIGFPAGKNKTILIDLSHRPRGARRIRLRTNMEIYWDSIAWTTPAAVTPRTQRLALASAELRFRGFSHTVEDRAAHAPETPDYRHLANVAPRWRDLVGYYTRYGDIRELLTDVDDRYVIMNAGDELRLTFDAPAPPPDSWRRDFVLIGDGWEKDGDFNTGHSQTVLPLPSHDNPAYAAAATELEQDPVYLRHPADWQRYHTRFVAPQLYLRGLRASRPEVPVDRAR